MSKSSQVKSSQVKCRTSKTHRFMHARAQLGTRKQGSQSDRKQQQPTHRPPTSCYTRNCGFLNPFPYTSTLLYQRNSLILIIPRNRFLSSPKLTIAVRRLPTYIKPVSTTYSTKNIPPPTTHPPSQERNTVPRSHRQISTTNQTNEENPEPSIPCHWCERNPPVRFCTAT
jgi:hypothetical protein